MKTKLFGTLAAGVAFSVLAFAGTAHADPADDAAIILENLPAAVDELVAGVQQAADTLASTQSVEATSADLRHALVAAGGALVDGTEQFGALGIGLLLLDLGLEQALAPFVQALDDPANAGNLINPDDFAVLQANLPAALDHVQSNLATAVSEALKGNLVAPGLLDPASGTPSLLGNTLALVGDLFSGGTAFLLLQGTTFQGIGTVVGISGLVGGGAVGGFVGEYLQQVEDALVPVFEALAPATAPIIDALAGV